MVGPKPILVERDPLPMAGPCRLPDGRRAGGPAPGGPGGGPEQRRATLPDRVLPGLASPPAAGRGGRLRRAARRRPSRALGLGAPAPRPSAPGRVVVAIPDRRRGARGPVVADVPLRRRRPGRRGRGCRLASGGTTRGGRPGALPGRPDGAPGGRPPRGRGTGG